MGEGERRENIPTSTSQQTNRRRPLTDNTHTHTAPHYHTHAEVFYLDSDPCDIHGWLPISPQLRETPSTCHGSTSELDVEEVEAPAVTCCLLRGVIDLRTTHTHSEIPPTER